MAPHGGNPRKSIIFVPPNTNENTVSSSDNTTTEDDLEKQSEASMTTPAISSAQAAVPLASPETPSDLINDPNAAAIELCDLSEESASGDFVRGIKATIRLYVSWLLNAKISLQTNLVRS